MVEDRILPVQERKLQQERVDDLEPQLMQAEGKDLESGVEDPHLELVQTVREDPQRDVGYAFVISFLCYCYLLSLLAPPSLLTVSFKMILKLILLLCFNIKCNQK